MTLKQPQNQGKKEPSTYRSKLITTPITQYLYTYSQSILRNYDDTRNNYDKAANGTKAERNLQRTRQQLKWLIDCNTTQYTKFVTLTTADQSQDRDLMLKRINYFFKKLRRKLAKQTPYTYLLERQQSGAWHSHIILYLNDYIPQRWLQELWGHGIVDIRKLRNANDTARYVMKYVTKEVIGSALNKKVFIGSPNLKRPTIEFSAEPLSLNNPNYIANYSRTIETAQGSHTTTVTLQEKQLIDT